jgi:release factor glutamine methyltransferase
MELSALLRSLSQNLRPVAEGLSLSEAERILEHTLRCTRSELYLCPKRPIRDEEIRRVDDVLLRRLTGTPLPYVLGVAHFFALDLAVTPDVLIPRPETEMLVETVLVHERASRRRFLDIGTGSGAIAAALTENRRDWTGIGVDCSRAALRIARMNCGKRDVRLLCCDMLSALKNIPAPAASSGFDFIVSNPPYVSADEMERLDESVRLFEPREALFGGAEGIDFYETLAAQGKNVLVKGGRLYCEIGATQSQKVTRLFGRRGWRNIGVFSDLAGRPRVVMAVA